MFQDIQVWHEIRTFLLCWPYLDAQANNNDGGTTGNINVAAVAFYANLAYSVVLIPKPFFLVLPMQLDGGCFYSDKK